MVGASARYSCLHTPVETSTPPYKGPSGRTDPGITQINKQWSCLFYSFSGSGYSTPKVSTVTLAIFWVWRGRSL